MQIDRIEETTDAQGRPECFISGSTVDPLTKAVVPFAKWLTAAEYARYQAGEPLPVILSGFAAQRVTANRQELGQDTVQLMALDALASGQYLPKDVDTEYTLQSPTGEIVTAFVPKGTAFTLPAGHSFIAEFPVGV